MFSRSPFHRRPFTRARLIVVCALLLIAALVMTKASAHRNHAAPSKGSKRQTLTPNLTFEDRVAAPRAIEAVYHRHRLWPTDKCAAQTSARRSAAQGGAAREG
jgi:hypothetical protein